MMGEEDKHTWDSTSSFQYVGSLNTYSKKQYTQGATICFLKIFVCPGKWVLSSKNVHSLASAYFIVELLNSFLFISLQTKFF